MKLSSEDMTLSQLIQEALDKCDHNNGQYILSETTLGMWKQRALRLENPTLKPESIERLKRWVEEKTSRSYQDNELMPALSKHTTLRMLCVNDIAQANKSEGEEDEQ